MKQLFIKGGPNANLAPYILFETKIFSKYAGQS